MIVGEEQGIRAQGMSLEVVWRNPLSHVKASLRSRQASNPHCRWAEQASKIRARRSNWDANHIWIA
jgi:hypothetical protein